MYGVKQDQHSYIYFYQAWRRMYQWFTCSSLRISIGHWRLYEARLVKSLIWSDWFIPLFGFSQWIYLSQTCVPSNCTTTPIPMHEHFRSVFNSSCRLAKSEQTSNLNNLNTSEIFLTSYLINIFSILPESAFAAFVRRSGGERKAEVKLTPMLYLREYHISNPFHPGALPNTSRATFSPGP